MKPLNHLLSIISGMLLLSTAHAQPGANTKNNIKKEHNMNTSKTNKEIVQQIYEQALNKRKMELLNDLVSDEFTGIGGKKGAAAFREPVQMLISAFPDIQWTIQELIGEDDKVAVKWKVQGTHKGPFNSFAATGKIASNEGMAIYELKNGKIAAVQVLTDRLGFLQQLEVLPNDLSVLANKNNGKRVLFIDKFLMPLSSKKEFYEKMSMNRSFIKTLPGFIEDAAFESIDDKGNVQVVTVAQWQSREAIDKAKEAVQAEYKKRGFDREELFRRLQVSMDRGLYTDIKE